MNMQVPPAPATEHWTDAIIERLRERAQEADAEYRQSRSANERAAADRRRALIGRALAAVAELRGAA